MSKLYVTNHNLNKFASFSYFFLYGFRIHFKDIKRSFFSTCIIIYLFIFNHTHILHTSQNWLIYKVCVRCGVRSAPQNMWIERNRKITKTKPKQINTILSQKYLAHIYNKKNNIKKQFKLKWSVIKKHLNVHWFKLSIYVLEY